VGCLLTTQQRAGPSSAVSRFSGTHPFPLNFRECRRQQRLENFVRKTLAGFGGIRRSGKIAEEVQYNFRWLEDRGWREVEGRLEVLLRSKKQEARSRSRDC
jgi:hypothetical protein